MKPRKPQIKLPSLSDDGEPPRKVPKTEPKKTLKTRVISNEVQQLRGITNEIQLIRGLTNDFQQMRGITNEILKLSNIGLKRTLSLDVPKDIKKQKMD